MKDQLETRIKPIWCPGCGNHVILSAFKRAIIELGIKREKIVVVSGIGCHGRISDYINVNSFHTIHGRVLPLALGIKLANKELIVVGFSGDGDAYAIGLEHLPHAAKKNVDIKFFVHNNMVYGLTKGQTSPTSPKGFITKSTPYGSPEEPLNPIALALISGATFVARGFVGEYIHLKELFKKAILHKGFAFIDILQPCVTYNNTYDYFRKRVYKLEDEGHDFTDFKKALEKAFEWNSRIPIGVFYQVRKKTYEEILELENKPPLVNYDITDIRIESLYHLFR